MGWVGGLVRRDLASLGRDSLFIGLLLTPLIILAMMRFVLPALAEVLMARAGFDLVPWYPLITAFVVLLNIPILFGTLFGFMMLDERDGGTLMALRASPVGLGRLLLYRSLLGIGLSVATSLGLLATGGLFAMPPLPDSLLACLAAAMMVPLTVLVLVGFAAGKMEGIALIKGVGVLMLGPLAAVFVDRGWQPVFWPLPTYWPADAFLAAVDGRGPLGPALIGIGWGLMLCVLLMIPVRRRIS